MRDEYDFEGAQRGRFFQPEAKAEIPIYLDDDVSRFLEAKASSKGIDLAQLVNELLRRDIELIQAVE